MNQSTNIEFIEREQDWQNETTRYWFRLDGSEYCVAESGPTSDILDADGKEIADRAIESKLRAMLLVTDEMRAA